MLQKDMLPPTLWRILFNKISLVILLPEVDCIHPTATLKLLFILYLAA